MSDKNNIKYYEKIIMLEDEIYDSDALDNYDAFILKCIKFAEKNIIPLSQYRKELEGILNNAQTFWKAELVNLNWKNIISNWAERFACQEA